MRWPRKGMRWPGHLEEEDEDDPLIPSVSDLVALRGDLNEVPVC